MVILGSAEAATAHLSTYLESPGSNEDGRWLFDGALSAASFDLAALLRVMPREPTSEAMAVSMATIWANVI